MTHVINPGRLRSWRFHCITALVLTACGSNGSGTGTGGTAGGQVTDAWRDYCIATFTGDVTIQDVGGETAFTAHAGEQYLLTEFDTFNGQPRARNSLSDAGRSRRLLGTAHRRHADICVYQ